MSIFDPWGDIDRTPKNTIYVPDETGWGWFALLILGAVPFTIVGFMLQSAASFVSTHPIITILGCILFSLAVGAFSYHSRFHHADPIGIGATVISFLPALAVEMIFVVPSALGAEGSVFSFVELFVEWFFLTLVFVGIGVFIHAINMLSYSPVRHIIHSSIYLVFSFLIISRFFNTEKMEQIKTIYLLFQ